MTSTIYTNYPELYDILYGGDTEDSVNFVMNLLDLLDITKQDQILDIGAGTGGILIPLVNQNYNVKGIEPAPGMIEIAKQKAKVNNIDINLTEGAFETLDVVDQYDLILSIDGSLHYSGDINSYQEIFHRLNDALHMNGYFVVDVINPLSIIKNYDHPEPLEFSINDTEFFAIVKHQTDLEKSLWYNKLYLFIKQENGQWKRIDDHQQMVMLTLRELKLYAQKAGFDFLYFFSSYKDRLSERKEGGRLIAVFQKVNF